MEPEIDISYFQALTTSNAFENQPKRQLGKQLSVKQKKEALT